MSSWIGWAATALFASSYLFREPRTLRKVQALAAAAWIAYGIVIKAPPVVVSNAVVAVLALASMGRRQTMLTVGPQESDVSVVPSAPPAA
jgi:hypothetical protein